jgi:hypothetical protein
MNVTFDPEGQVARQTESVGRVVLPASVGRVVQPAKRATAYSLGWSEALRAEP